MKLADDFNHRTGLIFDIIREAPFPADHAILCRLLIHVCVDHGISKQAAMQSFSDCWDIYHNIQQRRTQ